MADPMLKTRPAATAVSAVDTAALNARALQPATIVVGGPARSAPAHVRYEIHIDRDARTIAARLRGLMPRTTSTAFQTPVWLTTWYATIGVSAGKPMLVTVTESDSGELAAILPLVRRRQRGLTIVEFADGGVSDNNGPILGPAAPADRISACALWDALCKALPGVDLIRFTKMPATIEGRANPLALIDACLAAAVNRNVVTIEGAWERYLKSLERRYRKELGRSWRVFLGHEGAAFERITGAARAASVLAALERHQAAHLREQGADYFLDRPEVAAFYRKLLADGLADGSVILTALTRRTEVVSALLGIARGGTFVMVRIATGAKQWSNCSPGRLVIVRTMEMLHAQGFRHFDFSIGNYAYKRRLGVESQPLRDLIAATSVYGLPLQLWDRIRHWVRRSAPLHALARRLTRRRTGDSATTA
ncbi:MAG: GNAT family N-acetyltransferase [Xanthobacteraceae bacterium]|nr:GNAT family N-acetyltransferase [Xanthobacteraceae bacterium]